MNYLIFLNELMMKFRRSEKLNKKYFLAALIMFYFQLVLGINSAQAKLECYDEMLQVCKSDPGRPLCFDNEGAMEKEIYSKENIMADSITFYNEQIEFYGNRYKADGNVYSKYDLCRMKELKKRLLGANSSSQSSNQPPSSGSSSQSNQKANRQSANKQSSSSNSSNQSNQGSTKNSNTSSQNQSNSQSNAGATGTDAYSNLNMSPEQEVIVKDMAQTYATKTAAFEESHKGLRHKHNKEDEASRCLKLDGRQITNTCEFRVEYTFCAYNPDQNAFKAAFEMAAAFDCERRQMGMQGIRAMGKSAGTFTADAVYVFGCKDPSLPSGVTYERGRGLSGWCE